MKELMTVVVACMLLSKANVQPQIMAPDRTKASHVVSTSKPAPGNSNFKSYMDAKYITNKASDQYELKSKYKLSNEGIYKVGNRYCIAVGSFYTKKVGTQLDVRLSTGKVLHCILADCKADEHTDANNWQNPNGSVVEFIVHTQQLPHKVRQSGDCSHLEGFSGNVVEIIVISEGE